MKVLFGKKLKMSKINLITPPDILHNKNKSILCISLDPQQKQELQDLLAESNDNQNIYVYEGNQELDWLMNLHKMCDTVLVNLDNLDTEIRTIMSYLISFDNTYWLTKGEHMLYNKISSNRIYNIEQIKERIGG
tara:strand:+ start:508 stop:909 length:402 start_codon:yes stop_codon:yes gene_type:complete